MCVCLCARTSFLCRRSAFASPYFSCIPPSLLLFSCSCFFLGLFNSLFPLTILGRCPFFGKVMVVACLVNLLSYSFGVACNVLFFLSPVFDFHRCSKSTKTRTKKSRGNAEKLFLCRLHTHTLSNFIAISESIALTQTEYGSSVEIKKVNTLRKVKRSLI